MLLVSCSPSQAPIPSPDASLSVTPTTTAPSPSPSPTVVYPVPMTPDQKLTRGGAKAVVQRMVEITEGRPALKLDVTETNVTLTILTVDNEPMTLRWHDNRIDQVDSDVRYLGQTTFRPTDYPLGNVGELFETAQKLGAEGPEKVLQVVEYRRGEVFMTVSTRPETKTVFFEKDGAALRNLGFTSVADLTEGLAAVIGGSRATTQVGFASEIGYWADLPPSNGVVERRTRSSTLPVYLTRRNETTDLAPFDPTQVDALVLARMIAKYNTGDNQGCRVEIDNRFRQETPIVRYDCAGRIYYTDLAGTEYTEQELRS